MYGSSRVSLEKLNVHVKSKTPASKSNFKALKAEDSRQQ